MYKNAKNEYLNKGIGERIDDPGHRLGYNGKVKERFYGHAQFMYDRQG